MPFTKWPGAPSTYTDELKKFEVKYSNQLFLVKTLSLLYSLSFICENSTTIFKNLLAELKSLDKRLNHINKVYDNIEAKLRILPFESLSNKKLTGTLTTVSLSQEIQLLWEKSTLPTTSACIVELKSLCRKWPILNLLRDLQTEEARNALRLYSFPGAVTEKWLEANLKATSTKLFIEKTIASTKPLHLAEDFADDPKCQLIKAIAEKRMEEKQRRDQKETYKIGAMIKTLNFLEEPEKNMESKAEEQPFK
ncbi:uncharacterized protein LOC135120015 [Zophobas morio]|jgi:DNA-binding HxlR family transcriptional regulator|uniref:uncharacterized protein LOC135120015 n=1 Tax=Zophobas morio TaxID=2755281 RepID=UPI003082C4E0